MSDRSLRGGYLHLHISDGFTMKRIGQIHYSPTILLIGHPGAQWSIAKIRVGQVHVQVTMGALSKEKVFSPCSADDHDKKDGKPYVADAQSTAISISNYISQYRYSTL